MLSGPGHKFTFKLSNSLKISIREMSMLQLLGNELIKLWVKFELGIGVMCKHSKNNF